MIMREPDQFLRGTLRCDVEMSRHTSWRAGGRVERLYQPADLDDLVTFLRTLSSNEPLMAIGLGSNLLVREGGLRGTVLLLHGALNELRIETEGIIYAQAGVAGAKLARFAALNNLRGAEFFAGIPGTMGGMLAMNAGCYGSETWDVVTQVQVLGRSGNLQSRTLADYEIGYRHVALKCKEAFFTGEEGTAQQDEFFVGAQFKLQEGTGVESREIIKSLLTKRIASQPLNLPNAGSVFRNPAGDYAARLIESSGLKGKQIGGAQVSLKHANFIVNVGQATATDIEHLINEVQEVVLLKTGIKLHPEVRIVGEAA